MIRNKNNPELRLYLTIIQKKSLPDNELGKWLENYLLRYQEKLNALTNEASASLISYYSNNVPKKNSTSYRNIVDDSYYFDTKKYLLN